MGTGYRSRGKGYSKIFSEGMFWSLFYFYFLFLIFFFLFSAYHLPDYILVNVHFAVEQEKELVKLILTFSHAGFPLSKKKCTAWHISIPKRTKFPKRVSSKKPRNKNLKSPQFVHEQGNGCKPSSCQEVFDNWNKGCLI